MIYARSLFAAPLLSLITVIAASVPVEFSTAVTCRIPFESISNVTSICGTPFSTCGRPVRINDASLLLSYVPRHSANPTFVNGRSPSNTCTSTSSWKSSLVVNIFIRRVGIYSSAFLFSLSLLPTVLLRGMIFVITPPAVSTPNDSGTTSSRIRSVEISFEEPIRIDPCTAAP